MVDSETLSPICDISITKRSFVGNGWPAGAQIRFRRYNLARESRDSREVAEGERRVGLVPETVGKLVKDGFEVVVETGAGRDYNLDANYEEAGARIVEGAMASTAKPT